MITKSNKSPKPEDAAIGAKVRQIRMMRGMSQTALGDALGISFQQIQKYEIGANRIGASRLLGIAKTLHVSVPDLIGSAGEDAEMMPAFDVATRDVLRMMMDAPPETRGVIRDAVRTMIHATGALRNAIGGMKAAA